MSWSSVNKKLVLNSLEERRIIKHCVDVWADEAAKARSLLQLDTLRFRVKSLEAELEHDRNRRADAAERQLVVGRRIANRLFQFRSMSAEDKLLSMSFQCFVSGIRGSTRCVSSQYSQLDGSDSTIKEVSLFEAGLSPRVRSECHSHPTSFASMVSWLRHWRIEEANRDSTDVDNQNELVRAATAATVDLQDRLRTMSANMNASAATKSRTHRTTETYAPAIDDSPSVQHSPLAKNMTNDSSSMALEVTDELGTTPINAPPLSPSSSPAQLAAARARAAAAAANISASQWRCPSLSASPSPSFRLLPAAIAEDAEEEETDGGNAHEDDVSIDSDGERDSVGPGSSSGVPSSPEFTAFAGVLC